MTLFGMVWSDSALWFAAALVLGIAEILAPGFFLIFLGAGAASVGIVALIAPGLPVILQALLFAVATGALVAIGQRWYRGSDRPSADPLLNDRSARLIGKRVVVCTAILDGEGRVTVGDGAWNATGPDLPVGATVRIVGADGSVLRVEPA